MTQFKISGAGLSGLSAAINLAKNGNDVAVYEKGREHIKRAASYHCLSHISTPHGKNLKKYLKRYDIKINFNCKSFNRAELILDNGKQIEFKLNDPVIFVQRGNKKSIEYSLYKQAKKLGVKFKFDSDARKEHIDIVATGPSRTDVVGTGAVYDGVDFKHKYLVMFDDRFSPRGWYLYIVPHGKNRIEVMNIVSQPWVSQANKLYHKAVTKHPRIAEILDGAERIYNVGGWANCYIPKSAQKNNSIFSS
jgi:flavin-dependent dehydrogenase